MKENFNKCSFIKIVTPKKIKLNGLWFGSTKPKRVILFVHGLAGSAFQTELAGSLVSKDIAVITFGNRGQHIISKFYKIDKTKKGYHSVIAGQAHEVFTDCVDDIQGVIDFVDNVGVRDIYIAGHSTGCQKAVYYASRNKNQNKLKGLILFAPISDYSSSKKFDTDNMLPKIIQKAESMVQEGNKHELLPKELTKYPIDAQRFLSLNTPDSKEEIFTYARDNVKPNVYKSIKIPVSVFLAENDEYGDVSAAGIADWFESNTVNTSSVIKVVKNAKHGFSNREAFVSKIVKQWISKLM